MGRQPAGRQADAGGVVVTEWPTPCDLVLVFRYRRAVCMAVSFVNVGGQTCLLSQSWTGGPRGNDAAWHGLGWNRTEIAETQTL